MINVIIRGNWAPCAGTDYCYALGIYPSLGAANEDALFFAEQEWQPDEDDDGLEDEGPEYWVEEYNPEIHDDMRAGGGSFAEDFERMEK